MEFGKVKPHEIPLIDFSLPPDPDFNQSTFAKNKSPQKLEVYVGCAKWGIKDWVGQIFPEKTKATEFLEAYVKQFNSVELNATFYKTYGAETIAKWKEKAAANPDFLFCPKFSQTISHNKRLKNAAEITTAYYEGIMAFGEKLGPVFLQLSDSFSPKSFDDLQLYLEQLPQDVPVFVELRHASWFSDQEIQEKVFHLFRKLHIGTVITDASGRRDAMHMHLSTPTAFVRFVGNNLHATDYIRADEWVTRIKAWQEQGLEKLFLFMHQSEEKASPIIGDYFIEKLNKKLGLVIKRPTFISKPPELF
jgi:uncharacterized protein YecE (DUF72 family)